MTINNQNPLDKTQRTQQFDASTLLDCECLHWCDMRPDIRFLTGHHENCPKRGDTMEAAKQLIAELVRGIELWAAEEDGVYTSCWKPYKRAKAILGQFDWKEDVVMQSNREL